ICIAVAPMARARGGALCVPPAIDTCAPSRMSSSQTGAIQLGSLALSVLGLNAGFFPDLAGRATRFGGDFEGCFFFGGRFAGFFRATLAFCVSRFRDVFFAAARFAGRLRVEVRRFAMKCLAAAGTVDGARLVQRVVEITAARALGLERVVSADDAVAIVFVIGAKATADGAAFRGRGGHAER